MERHESISFRFWADACANVDWWATQRCLVDTPSVAPPVADVERLLDRIHQGSEVTTASACHACDAPLLEGARFCRVCGRAVDQHPPAVEGGELPEDWGTGPSAIARRTRRRWLLVGTGLLLVVAASAAAAIALTTNGEDGEDGDIAGPTSPALAEDVGQSTAPWRATDEVEIRHGGVDLAAGGDSVWVTDGNVLHRVDRSTMTVVDSVDMIGAAYNVAASSDSVWTVNNSPFEVVIVVDTSTGAMSEADPIPLPNDVDLDASSAWVLGIGSCARLDLVTAMITVECQIGGEAIEAAADDVWIVGDGLSRVDPQTGAVVGHLPLPGAGTAVASTEDAVWVVVDTRSRSQLLRIDPAELAISGIVDVGSSPEDGFPQGLFATETDVWVTNTVDGTLVHVDPDRVEVTQVLDVGTAPRGVAAIGEEVWVADARVGSNGEIGVVHLVTPDPTS